MRRRTFKKNRRGGKSSTSATIRSRSRSRSRERNVRDFIEAWEAVGVHLERDEARRALETARATESKQGEREVFYARHRRDVDARRASGNTASQIAAREERRAGHDDPGVVKARDDRRAGQDDPSQIIGRFRRNARRGVWPDEYHKREYPKIEPYLAQKKNP